MSLVDAWKGFQSGSLILNASVLSVFGLSSFRAAVCKVPALLMPFLLFLRFIE